MSHRSGDYLNYDRQFRLLRQSPNLPFLVVHPSIGLWLECRDAFVKGNNQNNNKGNGRQKGNFRPQTATNKSVHPYGFCFKFHETGKCPKADNCIFSHSCYTEGCTGKHPVFKCFKAQGGKTNQNIKPTSEQKTNNSGPGKQ